jgi:hypothetical protein
VGSSERGGEDDSRRRSREPNRGLQLLGGNFTELPRLVGVDRGIILRARTHMICR